MKKLLTLTVLALCLSPLAVHAQQEKPNVVIMMVDNLGWGELGVYGGGILRGAETPRLDQLAEEGMQFLNFNVEPQCTPSRSAFMTGMYQTTTDTHPMRSHRSDDFRLPAGVRPLTHWLADAGYFTANITHIGDREVVTGKLDLNFV
ncbi:MAG: sulfatase-like hydrolase/transferase, partial [Bacteroidetes bacterium]|nr:sulfatase-like hydrolase/transferase [Bacteroidota bacterium]